MRVLAAAVAVAVLLGATACSDQDGLAYAEDPTAPTTLIAEPSVTVEAGERDFVIFHAAWLCEFQRRTFATPADGDEALVEQLRRSGMDAGQYDEFLQRLGSSQDLRDAVLYEYQETCLR